MNVVWCVVRRSRQSSVVSKSNEQETRDEEMRTMRAVMMSLRARGPAVMTSCQAPVGERHLPHHKVGPVTRPDSLPPHPSTVGRQTLLALALAACICTARPPALVVLTRS